MTQIIDPIPLDSLDTVLCCYINNASKIQVVRITNIQNWYFERVVFPGQKLMFEASIKGQLEVHSGSMASSILEDTVPCSRLVMESVDEDSAEAVVDVKQPVHSS